MSVTATSATSTTTSSTSSSSTNAVSSLSTSDFLTLLVEQLQNQNPLSPTDTDKMMSEMVSFASYQQQQDTNTSLATISSTLDGIATSLNVTA